MLTPETQSPDRVDPTYGQDVSTKDGRGAKRRSEPLIGSSGMLCLRMWCLIITVLSPSIMVKPGVSFGNIYYYQTPHPQTPHP